MSVEGVLSGRQIKAEIILEGVFVSSLNKSSDFFLGWSGGWFKAKWLIGVGI